VWAGFEDRRAGITVTLFALFRQWAALQSFVAVGPEFSYTLINQATSFLAAKRGRLNLNVEFAPV
jgi:hypothetical protein